MLDRALARRGAGLLTVAKPLAFFLLLPALLGCPDFKPVQQLAKTAADAEPALIPIAADFKGSCDRQNYYTSFPPAANNLNCSNADDWDKLGNNILKEQALLLKYFKALGTLAETDATGFITAAPSLDTTFTSDVFTTTQEEMARDAGVIAADITKLATRAYREKKIVEILWEADPAVQRYTRRLADQVSPGTTGAHPASYLDQLHNEDRELKDYYDLPLRKDSTSPSAILLIKQYRSEVSQQAKREEAAVAYRNLMLALGKAHAKLLFDAQQQGGLKKQGSQKIAFDLAGSIAEAADAINTLQKDAR